MNLTTKIGIPGYCQIVSGHEGHIMFNLERNKYVQLPEVFYEILTKYRHLSVQELALLYEDTQGKIKAFLNSLMQAGFVFETNDTQQYPPINPQWNRPERIFTAMIAYHTQSPYSLIDVFNQLNDLGTKYLEVRFSGSNIQPTITDFLHKSNKSRVVMVDIMIDFKALTMPFSSAIAWANNLWQQYPKLNRVLLYNAPKTLPTHNNLYISNQPIDLLTSDTLFRKDKYYINAEFFKESLQFNPYYNRKVCIDEAGKIKNCFLLPYHWGLLPSDNIAEVIDTDDFRALWYWNNDKDEVLKTSAFRYVLLNRLGG